MDDEEPEVGAASPVAWDRGARFNFLRSTGAAGAWGPDVSDGLDSKVGRLTVTSD